MATMKPSKHFSTEFVERWTEAFALGHECDLQFYTECIRRKIAPKDALAAPLVFMGIPIGGCDAAGRPN